jgi:hypothetical protein
MTSFQAIGTRVMTPIRPSLDKGEILPKRYGWILFFKSNFI